MATVLVEGKPMSLPDSIVDAGIEAVRMALSVDVPDVENADIQIQRETAVGSPAIVTSRNVSVVKHSTPKG